MPPILGTKRHGEPPNREQAVSALSGRGSLRCPVDNAAAAHDLVSQTLRMSDEQPKQGMLRTEFEAECAMEIGVSLQVVAQHEASLGQGWAICSSMGTLTLA